MRPLADRIGQRAAMWTKIAVFFIAVGGVTSTWAGMGFPMPASEARVDALEKDTNTRFAGLESKVDCGLYLLLRDQKRGIDKDLLIYEPQLTAAPADVKLQKIIGGLNNDLRTVEDQLEQIEPCRLG